MKKSNLLANSQAGIIWRWVVVGVILIILVVSGAHFVYYHFIHHTVTTNPNSLNSGLVNPPR